MALTPTIYKFAIDLSDLDRNHYDALDLVVARHPSESAERMLVRVMAFCINAGDGLAFGKGLSDTEEPALWSHTLDGQTSLWIEVGEPKIERIKKASSQAAQVRIYCFNTKVSVWWPSIEARCRALRAEVFQFESADVANAATQMERTMQMSVTISEQSAYVATASGEFELTWKTL
jgi:uncharacterized protein YaeQ